MTAGPEDPALGWLLDHSSPAVRYRTRLWLGGEGPDSPEVRRDKAALLSDPTVASILAAQRPDGSWGGPSLYAPRHRSTFHTLAVLAEFGLDRSRPEIARGAKHCFAFQAANGEFYIARRAAGGPPAALAPIPCLTARMASTLCRLGYAEDPRVVRAVRRLVSIQRQDGSWSCEARAIPRDHVSEKGCLGMAACFLSLAEAVPALLADHPATRAAAQFVEKLYLQDPKGYHVGDTWSRLTHPYFPLDLAETGRLLLPFTGLTPRVEKGLRLCVQKRRRDGLWAADGHPSKPPYQPERRGQPNPWVTLRVMRFLAAARAAGWREA